MPEIERARRIRVTKIDVYRELEALKDTLAGLNIEVFGWHIVEPPPGEPAYMWILSRATHLDEAVPNDMKGLGYTPREVVAKIKGFTAALTMMEKRL